MYRRTILSAVFFLIPALAWAQTAEEKKETVAFLQKLQASQGGFLAGPISGDGKETPSLRATSAALRGLKYFGGEPRDRKACIEFVQSCFDASTGGFADRPGAKSDVTTTAVGIMVVVELKMPPKDYEEKVVQYLSEHAKTFEEIRIAAAGLEAIGKRSPETEAWLKVVAKTANEDGTFGKGDAAARDTGGAAALVLRLGGKLEHKEAVLKALKDGQRKDGGFGKGGAKESDLETTYRVMRAFMMLKEKPADPEALRKFVARCRNTDGGYGITPGKPSQTGPTYFASIILHWNE